VVSGKKSRSNAVLFASFDEEKTTHGKNFLAKAAEGGSGDVASYTPSFPLPTWTDDEINETQHFEVEQCLDPAIKNTKTPCCTDSAFPALGGIDVVNLFSQPENTLPLMGTPEFSATLSTGAGDWQFWFVNEDHKDLFVEDPWKYAPSWGGFCGYGMAFEDKSGVENAVEKLGPYVDLGAWTIYNNRLFFFGNSNVKSKFVADGENGLQIGDSRWQKYYASAPEQGQDGHFVTNCFHTQTFNDLISRVRSEDMRQKT